jgi:hypothetical protein
MSTVCSIESATEILVEAAKDDINCASILGVEKQIRGY